MIFGRYKFTIRLADDAQLPYYKGSTFRGVLGHALREVMCALLDQDCATCILRSDCTYAMVFETAHAVALPKGVRISSAPHPLVLEPPLTQKTHFNKGDTLTCMLLLFGEINSDLPHLIYAFEQMGQTGIGKKIAGRRSQFVLESVTTMGSEELHVYKKNDYQITLPEQTERLSYGQINSDYFPLNSNGGGISNGGSITLAMITPLRIIARDAPVARLPFSVLMSTIMRRVTSLLNVYGEGEPDLDYPGIIAAAKNITIAENSLQWLDWKRYSSRQDKKMFLGGLTGSITYQGNFKQFLPMMEMAEKVHIGKNSSFGLGKIQFHS